ncbi:uncharacterized protein EDB93DRAFT_1078998, partial [Suillus bovinus]|uniref:uncharacterized protein n=1 Tax=Suillus bovinus TaxID=48563 RepID=UPI001B85D87A
IALLQFWRGEQEFLRPYPLHWALYVETSPDVGNTYEIVGDQNTYTFRMTENQPFEHKGYRGGCCVGRLNSEEELALMGDILKKVEIFQDIPTWNSHNWVKTALRTLRHSGFCIDLDESIGNLQYIMLHQLESWFEITHGVEGGVAEYPVQFVGYEYLDCVLHSRLRMLQRRAHVGRRGLYIW